MFTNTKRYWSVLIIFVALIAASCAGPRDGAPPVAPQIQAQNAPAPIQGRQLWGFWEGYLSPSGDSIDMVPVREIQLHLNARRFLEDTACKDCLKILKIEKDLTAMTATATIQLTHPFSGMAKYTGFDVRGIVITDGSRLFPTLNVRMPDSTLGDFTLLNPDGYTRLWNTVDFPTGSGPLKILEYSQGKHAYPGSFTATVNPYIEFAQDPRSSFPPGSSMTREFKLKMIPGGGKFGYAVDASWEPPTVDPPVDLMTDFPESANALEPYVITTVQDVPLDDNAGSSATFTVQMVDRQAYSNYSTTQLECPDLWTGTIEPDIWGMTPGTPLWYPIEAVFQIQNEKAAAEGTYLAMFKVVDNAQDPYLGNINERFAPVWITVQHKVVPKLTGEIIYVAPGAPDPSGNPGPPNIFMLDVATMVSTQLTSFIGVGAMFQEPRINPKGTHVLYTWDPNPMDSVIDIFQLGGSTWTASPPGVFDATADFAPDQDKVLVASGTGYLETPDLYSMKFDGSERTLIATAPGPVRGPKWSPDGKRIVMSIEDYNSFPPSSSLYIYDIGLGTFTELVPAQGQSENPSWSPVQVLGHYLIAFDSNRADPMSFSNDIYVANPDTGEILETIDTGYYNQHPSFSPDALYLVFAVTEMMGGNLYVYDMVNHVATPLTSGNDYLSSPSWCWGW